MAEKKSAFRSSSPSTTSESTSWVFRENWQSKQHPLPPPPPPQPLHSLRKYLTICCRRSLTARFSFITILTNAASVFAIRRLERRFDLRPPSLFTPNKSSSLSINTDSCNRSAYSINNGPILRPNRNHEFILDSVTSLQYSVIQM